MDCWPTMGEMSGEELMKMKKMMIIINKDEEKANDHDCEE